MKKLIAIVLTLSAARRLCTSPTWPSTTRAARYATPAVRQVPQRPAMQQPGSPRMAKGMEVLVASVNNGLNAMPPKGMCFDCTDADYTALIEYMAAPAQ